MAFGEGYGLTEALNRARLTTRHPETRPVASASSPTRSATDALISIGHAGSEPGYGADLAYYPCSGTVFAAMSNVDFDPAMAEILTAVQPLVQELATGGCPPAAPTSTG